MILLTAAALLASIALEKWRRDDPFVPHWAALAAIFLGLSLDEAASLHEMSMQPLRNRFGLRGPLYFAWVIPGSLFALAVAASYWRFLRSLPPRTGRVVLAAGLLYVAGAVGFEMAGAWQFDRHGSHNPAYSLCTTMEEMFEMAGIILFIHGLLGYMAVEVPRISLRIEPCDTRRPRPESPIWGTPPRPRRAGR